jgi:hypothetical protein
MTLNLQDGALLSLLSAQPQISAQQNAFGKGS